MRMRAPDGNFFSGYDVPRCGELFHEILQSNNVVIERIVSGADVQDTVYCQEQDEWVVVLKGGARLEIGNGECLLGTGDYVFIAAGVSHRVVTVENGTLWLAVHIFKGPR